MVVCLTPFVLMTHAQFETKFINCVVFIGHQMAVTPCRFYRLAVNFLLTGMVCWVPEALTLEM